jgi:hypothetical protein
MVYVISEDNFADLCNRLQSNDPDTTSVVVRWKRAAGLDYRLGQALLANTVVTTLDLDVTSLLCDDVTDNTNSVNPLLEYIEKSNVLKCVKLCQEGVLCGPVTHHAQHTNLMTRIDAAIG